MSRCSDKHLQLYAKHLTRCSDEICHYLVSDPRSYPAWIIEHTVHLLNVSSKNCSRTSLRLKVCSYLTLRNVHKIKSTFDPTLEPSGYLCATKRYYQNSLQQSYPPEMGLLELPREVRERVWRHFGRDQSMPHHDAYRAGTPTAVWKTQPFQIRNTT